MALKLKLALSRILTVKGQLKQSTLTDILRTYMSFCTTNDMTKLPERIEIYVWTNKNSDRSLPEHSFPCWYACGLSVLK